MNRNLAQFCHQILPLKRIWLKVTAKQDWIRSEKVKKKKQPFYLENRALLTPKRPWSWFLQFASTKTTIFALSACHRYSLMCMHHGVGFCTTSFHVWFWNPWNRKISPKIALGCIDFEKKKKKRIQIVAWMEITWFFLPMYDQL